MFAFVHGECERLGMTLWAYDQVGYGHYGWLEKAAAKAGRRSTKRIHFLLGGRQCPGADPVWSCPQGRLWMPVLIHSIDGRRGRRPEHRYLRTPYPAGYCSGHRPTGPGGWPFPWPSTTSSFQLSERRATRFIDMFYGEIERQVGHDAMGTSFAGVFQDEHPPTPRDVYTEELAELFRQRCGYDIGRAIPALHFDVGPLTPKYRTDFFDTYLAVDEQCYWKRVYDWTAERGLLTSHDNWGRQNIDRQSQGYIDYFRTQRWFSAPGYDDAGTGAGEARNYYDTKIAASIARLYHRPRVWSEAFHSSGWGRTTDQTLSWLSANYAFGANLYDEHGLYYSDASQHVGTCGARSSLAATLLAILRHAVRLGRAHELSDEPGHTRGRRCRALSCREPAGGRDAGSGTARLQHYMQISRRLFDAAMDNDIIDDDSILEAAVENGQMVAGRQPLSGTRFRSRKRPCAGPYCRRRSTWPRVAARWFSSEVFRRRLRTAVATIPQLPDLLERLFGEQPADIDLSEGVRRDMPARRSCGPRA